MYFGLYGVIFTKKKLLNLTLLLYLNNLLIANIWLHKKVSKNLCPEECDLKNSILPVIYQITLRQFYSTVC